MSNSLFSVTPVARQIVFDRLKTDDVSSVNLEDALVEINENSKTAKYLTYRTVARGLTLAHNFQQFPVVQVLEALDVGDAFSFDPYTIDAFANSKFVVADQNKYLIEHLDENSIQFSQDSYSPVILILRA